VIAASQSGEVMTIGERREELTGFSFSRLRRLFRRVEKQYGGQVQWVDRRKRLDLIQAIINFEIGIGGKVG
jgi:hypothetical protein